MIEEIDIQRTIETQKLCFLTSYFYKFARLIFNLSGILPLPIASTTYLLKHLDSFTSDIIGQVMSILFSYGIGTMLTFFFINSSEMTRIEKKGERQNIIKAIKELHW